VVLLNEVSVGAAAVKYFLARREAAQEIADALGIEAAPRQGDHPAKVVTRRVSCPRPSTQFQIMLFRSIELLAKEGRDNLGVWVTQGWTERDCWDWSWGKGTGIPWAR